MNKNKQKIEVPNIGMTLSRALMPQFDDPRPFLRHLKDKFDVKHTVKNLDTKDLKSTQSEFDDLKISQMMFSGEPKKPILVSTDGHILDGHHRWLADHNTTGKVKAYVIDHPVLEIRKKAQDFASLNEEITHKEFGPMMDSFVSFASEKLGIKSIPSIKYKDNKENFTSFGGYQPSDNCIVIATKNRHPMDIYRTLAHELVHHKQNEDGRIKDVSKEGSTGSPIEDEANAIAGRIMRWYAKANPKNFDMSNLVESHMSIDEEFDYMFTEGIRDPAKLKAVFMAGGPGSGKDYVMNQITGGHGLTEINSDNAFEFLMGKEGLDKKMPASQAAARVKVRGRAKNITKEKQRLALLGRQGVIINGTGDDPDKVAAIKSELERHGYDTMMAFVNTSNEVSRQRNFMRGMRGGRKAPDGTDAQGRPDGSEDIRGAKWKQAQAVRSDLRKIFGDDNYIEVNNDHDTNNPDPEANKKHQTQLYNHWKNVRKFVATPPSSKIGQKWIESQSKAGKRETARAYAYGDPRKNVPTNPFANTISSTAEAKALGLTYYGFGRYGKTINDKPTVTHTYGNGRLNPISTKSIKEEKVNDDLKETCWKGYYQPKNKKLKPKKGAPGQFVPNCIPKKKTIDEKFSKHIDGQDTYKREWGTNSLTDMYKKDTPGQQIVVDKDYMIKRTFPMNPLFEKKKVLKRKKKLEEDGLPSTLDAFNSPYTIGNSGIGDEYSTRYPGSLYGLGSATSVSSVPGMGPAGTLYPFGTYGIAESIITWANKPETIERFNRKYGKLAEQKLIEAVHNLNESSDRIVKMSKSFKQIRESWDAIGKRDMGTVPSQSKEEIGEDWQKINRKDRTSGMSAKAVKAYRRKHPGSKLQTAVTKDPSKIKSGSKDDKRRKSFCRRMGGMKKRLTSAETARDPNSRINKALRRWNCEE